MVEAPNEVPNSTIPFCARSAGQGIEQGFELGRHRHPRLPHFVVEVCLPVAANAALDGSLADLWVGLERV